MRLNESLHLHLESLLMEARQARDPSTNGLLDRTDCLDLISRLAAGIQQMLGVTGVMQEDRDEAADEFGGLAYSGSRPAAFATDPDRRGKGSHSNMANWPA